MIHTTTPLFILKLVLFILNAGRVHEMDNLEPSCMDFNLSKPPNQMHIGCADENIISRYSKPN